MRGRLLWTPVGRRGRGWQPIGSIPPKAARRLDADQLAEIEIDNRLQRLAGGAVTQRLGQRIEPGGILGL
jgi:hypothetical protein